MIAHRASSEDGFEALFKRGSGGGGGGGGGGALEFQEDRERDNSLAPPTELDKMEWPL